MAPAIPRRQRNWQTCLTDYFDLSGVAEAAWAVRLTVFLILFKLVGIMSYGFDSDEPQHLHVIWGWARGFVQYRDLCDNHMPLFQIMFAPIFGLIGDRADTLYWLRFILVVPMSVVVAWCIYRIGMLLKRGLLPDNASQRCVETRTCVVAMEKGMSPATTRFVETYFLPIGYGLRVAGQLVRPAPDGESFGFEIVIPDSYKIIAVDGGEMSGLLDGARYDGEARFLQPGQHEFVSTNAGRPCAAVWARAMERGFAPLACKALPYR